MRKYSKLIVLAGLLAGVACAQENLLVNPSPTAADVSGYRHSIDRGGNKWGQTEIQVQSPGVLIFDNSAHENFTKGVVRFELKQLVPGEHYTVSFEAQAVTKTGFNIMLPAADPGGEVDGKGNPLPKRKWVNLQKRWLPVTMNFVYEPGVNYDAITLFLPPTMKESVFKLRKIKVIAQPVEGKVRGYRYTVNQGGSVWTPVEVQTRSPGVLIVDNSAQKSFTQGVFHFELKQLVPGEQYTVSFEAQAKTKTGFNVKLPAVDPGGDVDTKGDPLPKRKWINLPKRWHPFTMNFVYKPGMNKDAVTLYLPPTMKDSVFEIRNFKVTPKPLNN